MPYDSGGLFSLVPSYKATSGQTIRTEQHNPPLEDIAAALSSVLVRDGRAGMVANLPMGGFRITNLGNGTASDDAATVGQLQSVLPIGAMVDFGGDTAPSGWLLCAGQAVSRSAYADLFAVIGTRFGAGNGTTTFNVPDYRGRVGAGRDNMGGTAAGRLTNAGSGVTGTTIGAVGGSESHTLTTAQMPSHTHTGTTNNAGAQSLTIDAGLGAVFDAGAPLRVGRIGGSAGTAAGIISAIPNHTHTFTTDSAGTGQAHNNVQPTIIVTKIIKASY